MVEKFYKITKEQAEILGKIEYKKGCVFNPFCSEQNDGTYLVRESMYNELKEFFDNKKIDLSKQIKLTVDQLDFKPVTILGINETKK